MPPLTRPLSHRAVHLCVDMQRIFAPGGIWPTPWMSRVLPVISELVAWSPDRTFFTRFIPPEHPQDMPGMWQVYYSKWREATREYIDVRLLELMPELLQFVPPAEVVDKTRYSAFSSPRLFPLLQARGVEDLIVTGAETDVCVLSTVLDAVDLGYRVIVARDAICSSSDRTHDASMELYHKRYALQIETADAQDILSGWPRA